MKSEMMALSKDAREVFLLPTQDKKYLLPLFEITEKLSGTFKQIALAFIDNLESVLSTVSIPFQYTCTLVQNLHFQKLHMVERIKLAKISFEPVVESQAEKDEKALKNAKLCFQEFMESEGGNIVARDVLERLLLIKNDVESLKAARELICQGLLLIWGAFEVLARDLFIELLNRHPVRIEMFLNNPSSRKRFGLDKIDWTTLNNFGFDLSKNVGTIVTERIDLDDILTIKDAYSAIFPSAIDLGKCLSDRRLWILFQKRNLIVHRRGIIDQQYIEKIGESIPIGSKLIVTPAEVEDYLFATTSAGQALLTEIGKTEQS
jgi:hypothetical protein